MVSEFLVTTGRVVQGFGSPWQRVDPFHGVAPRFISATMGALAPGRCPGAYIWARSNVESASGRNHGSDGAQSRAHPGAHQHRRVAIHSAPPLPAGHFFDAGRWLLWRSTSVVFLLLRGCGQ